MGPHDKAGLASQKQFWGLMLRGWERLERTNETVHASAVLPTTWRQDDLAFDAACQAQDRQEDLRVVELTRRRAIEGNERALNLSFRALQPPARATVADPRQREPQPLDPEVAARMLEAMLESLGETIPSIPDPVYPQPLNRDPAPASPPALRS